MGTRPPSGVNESCIALTEPLEAPVVAVAHRAEFTIPNRVSFPSMLPPAWSALAVWSTPCCAKTAPRCSATTQTARSTTKMTVIAASTAQPWRVSPTMTPNV